MTVVDRSRQAGRQRRERRDNIWTLLLSLGTLTGGLSDTLRLGLLDLQGVGAHLESRETNQACVRASVVMMYEGGGGGSGPHCCFHDAASATACGTRGPAREARVRGASGAGTGCLRCLNRAPQRD